MKSRSRFLFPILLIIITTGIYADTLDAEFHFDDYAYILDSAEVRSIQKCLTILKDNPMRPDRILVSLSFAANYRFHGFDLPGYHIVNIGVHLLNGLLLFFLLLELIKQAWPESARNNSRALSFCSSLFFLVHPVAVNSVTYITQRHVLIATFFYLATTYFYIRARKSKSTARILFSLLTILSCWAAIHSKPMAITIPIALLAIELLLRNNVDASSVRMVLKKSLPFLLVILCAFFFYSHQAGLFSTNNPLAGFNSRHLWSPWQHMLTESVVFIHYWLILFAPLPQWISADHYFPVVQSVNWIVIVSWALHGLILFSGYTAIKRNYLLYGLGVAWFYITLSPPYLFLPILDVMVDYKTYLPSVGLSFIIADSGRILINYRGRKTLAVLTTVIFIFFAVASHQRNKVFQSEENFWADVIKKYPDEPRPYNNKGLACQRKENYREAISYFEKAIAVSPKYSLAYANLGDSYSALGRPHKAAEYYTTFIRLQPDNDAGYSRLATLYAKQGQWQQASANYKKAASLNPGDANHLYNLGLSYGYLGKIKPAIHAMHQALLIEPGNVKILTSTGALFHLHGDREKSIRFYRKALDRDPLHADALFNLTVLYIKENALEKAKEYAERLMKVDQSRGERLSARIESIGKKHTP